MLIKALLNLLKSERSPKAFRQHPVARPQISVLEFDNLGKDALLLIEGH